MTDFLKAMKTLERRFTSGNSVPIESARITAEEFEAINGEIERLVFNEEYLLTLANLHEQRISDLESDVQEYAEAQPPI